MYKKFFSALLLGAMIIACCIACRTRGDLPGTTAGSTAGSTEGVGSVGAVDSPWGTTAETQAAQPSKGSPLPGEDGTVSTDASEPTYEDITTRPTQGTTEPTQGTTNPTQSATQPTQPTPGTTEALTYEAWLALDAHGKQLYMESFAVHEDFIDWMVAAKEEYDRQNPAIEVDGTGAYTVPQ